MEFTDSEPSRIVVVGVSTEGLSALSVVLPTLPCEIDAAILLVVHLGAHGSVLPQLLARQTTLRIDPAGAGMLYGVPRSSSHRLTAI
jgi:two-component system chemotaxis response regulator CheB